MNLRKLMESWQKRGVTFGRRSGLLRRKEALEGIMKESLTFLRDTEGLVLDVGCGDGIPATALVQNHPVLGLDFSSTMLHRAHVNLPSVDLLRGSIDHLPLRDGSVPAATCYFVLSDYDNRRALIGELRRVLMPLGRLVVADYSSNDDFNNLLDDLQKKVLGKDRGMFRLDMDMLSGELRDTGFNIRGSKEMSYPINMTLTTFVDQLHLSSVGVEYKERHLSEEKWRELLPGRLVGSEIRLARRFALVLAEKVR